MKYEIGREVFKQRLEERLNFAIVNVDQNLKVAFDNCLHIPFNSDFYKNFSSQCPNKSQNIILFTSNHTEDAIQLAANQLEEQGYHFVYYFRGSENDVVLDKGLN